MKELVQNVLENVTVENWKKCIEHVKKEETKMWQLDDRIDIVTDPLII